VLKYLRDNTIPMNTIHPRQMHERRLSMFHAGTILARNGLSRHGENLRRTEITLFFKNNGPMLEKALVETGERTYKDALRKLLSDVAGTVIVKEIKPPQPLPDEMGRRAEASEAIRNPIGLLIRIL